MLFRPAISVLLLLSGGVPAEDTFEPAARVLITRCLECHKGDDPSGGLSFDSAATFHAESDSGSVIDRDQPANSLLLQRVHDHEMPPPVKGRPQPLPQAEVKQLKQWIAAGAPWPRKRELDLYEFTTDVRGGRDWWAFQPVRRPTVPVVDNVNHPVDAFIFRSLLKANLTPAPPADDHALIRRLYYDVIGLPPSFAAVKQWKKQLTQNRDKSTATLIDELLNRPQFGERWARYWLDLVRYADTSGYERDQPKTHSWKYRDWVVQSINDDLPYDDFVRQQLAGDELDDRSTESLIATGFLRLGTWNDEPNDPADYVYERLEDMVHVTSSAFLGLTAKCARCHDHKFDPIPQHDYYRLASVFWAGPVQSRDRKYLGGPSPEELGTDDILGWTDLSADPEPLHVLKNGERHHPLQPAVPGPLSLVPDLFTEFSVAPVDASTSHRRRQLAEWIVNPHNPLAARVCVNRIWQHHFGDGLVRTPNNFGFKGERPTHPELLDWLAAELIDHNWSQRHIHRLILTSQTWQQSSVHPAAAQYSVQDSQNRRWWRANQRRLDAEALRDSLLAVSGELKLTIGGEGFVPDISREALEGLSRKGTDRTPSSADQQKRRSLYLFASRSLAMPLMTTFDQCDSTLPCGRRDSTTAPTQALAMLNNDFVHARSNALAASILTTGKGNEVTKAWTRILGRQPTDAERLLSQQHLSEQQQRFKPPPGTSEDGANPTAQFQALASLCHVLLNSNEFLYVD